MRVLRILPVLSLVACAHAEVPVRIPADAAKTRLVFFTSDAPLKNGFLADAKLEKAEKDAEEALLNAKCGTAPKAAGLALILGYAIDKGISFLVDRVDKALQDEISTYTSAYNASAQTNFYNGGSTLDLANRCMRVTRVRTEDEKQILMDLLVSFELDGKERLLIKPLRLYYANPAVKTDNGNYGFSASLKLDATWRQDNRSLRDSDLPDVPLLSERIPLASNETHFYRIYDGKMPETTRPGILAPLPPWSTYGIVQYGGNLTTATVSIAEAGHVPDLLKKAAELFSDNKDKVKDQLKDALNKAAGLE